MVPIKAKVAYTSIGDPVVCEGGGFNARDVRGPGNASHLGKIAADFDFESCVFNFPILTIEGLLTLTGANGDAISGPAIAEFDVTAIGPDGVGPFSVTEDITGGTGRFEGATGSYTGTGLNDFNTASGTFTLNGTVSSVGSL